MKRRSSLAVSPAVLSAFVLCPGVAHAQTRHWAVLPGPHLTYRLCCGPGASKAHFGAEVSVVMLRNEKPVVGGFFQVTPVGPSGGPLLALGGQMNYFIGSEAGLALWGGGDRSAGGAGVFLTPHASIGVAFVGLRFTFPGATVDGSTPPADIDIVMAAKIPIGMGSNFEQIWSASPDTGITFGHGRPIMVDGALVVADLWAGEAWDREASMPPVRRGGDAVVTLKERLMAVASG